MVACERSLFFLTKGLVSGGIDRKAHLKPYFFTFIMKNFIMKNLIDDHSGECIQK
jgi:hypothetical protein